MAGESRLAELMRQLAEEHEKMRLENQSLKACLRSMDVQEPTPSPADGPAAQANVLLPTPRLAANLQAGSPQHQIRFRRPSQPSSEEADATGHSPRIDADVHNKSATATNLCLELPTMESYPDRSDKVIGRRFSSLNDTRKDAGRWLRQKIHAAISTRRFDIIMGLIIIANSLLMGVESTARLRNWDTSTFAVCEHIFLSIYIVELLARIYAYGWSCFDSGWVRFDAVLVVLGVLGSWVIPIIVAISSGERPHAVEDTLSGLLLVRAFRLFRLARALRLLVQFRTLRMLVQGLLQSSTTIVYTLGLIIMILYIFSCISMDLMTIPWTGDDSTLGRLVDEYWADIPSSMLTLVRFVVLDGITGVYEPMVTEHSYLLVFFVSFLLIVSIALMNLVTAVIVEGALDQAKRDKAAVAHYKREQLNAFLPRLRSMFDELDSNSDGFLTLDEVLAAPENILELLEGCLGTHTLEELFRVIDEDGSGEVSVDEFCHGLTRLACNDAPIELFTIMTQLAHLRGFLEKGSWSADAEPLKRPQIEATQT